jgi:tripartite ATP-independent transporter DctP family solute receptor
MKTIARRSFCAAAAAAALLPFAAQAQDIKERTIKFSFTSQKDHPQTLGAEKFAELVSQKSGKKLAVKIFGGGVLGGDLQNVSAVQGGTLEMTCLNAGILSSHVKELGVLDLPFLFTNEKEADAVVDGPVGQAMLAKLADKGMIGLGYWELGFRNLTNSKRPITKVEDIARLKIRVNQSPIYIDIFNTLVANATPMPFPEVYGALEQHAIDGQENPVATILASRFNEVQKHLTLTRHIYNPMALLISKKFWDTLSPTEKKILGEAATEAGKYEREVSRRHESQALETLRKSGMQVTELAPGELEKLRQKLKPVVDRASEKIGGEIVAAVNAELAKVRAK